MNQSAHQFFRHRNYRLLLLITEIVVLYLAAAALTGFNSSAWLATDKGIIWLAQNFIPNANSLQYMPDILAQLWQTFLITVAAASCAAVIAVVLGMLGAQNVGLSKWKVGWLIRGFASVMRNIPIVAWAMILLFSFKQNELTGFLALLFMNIGFLTRAFLETFEDFDVKKMEAIQTIGATYTTSVVQAMLPETAVPLIEWLLYMIENNIRDATLVGLLTGTGIGFIFDLYFKSLQYGAAGMVVVSIAVLVIFLEISSNRIGRSIR
jgi:phosphonate transport system permease protein